MATEALSFITQEPPPAPKAAHSEEGQGGKEEVIPFERFSSFNIYQYSLAEVQREVQSAMKAHQKKR